jgi:hypothetical protein
VASRIGEGRLHASVKGKHNTSVEAGSEKENGGVGVRKKFDHVCNEGKKYRYDAKKTIDRQNYDLN